MELRPVRNADADGLFALIGACFAEYEDVHLEPDGLDKDLHAYADEIEAADGIGLVAEEGGRITALASGAPVRGGLYQLKRFYLDASHRGSGFALTMLARIEEAARAAGASEIELWSDTRFTRAHRFYEREGYRKSGKTRDLHDISNTTEFHFIKSL